MQLQMTHGEEGRLIVSKNITDSNQFMYPAYQQALDALDKIVNKARKFWTENDSADFNLQYRLYGYPNSIIAFSAGRGQGKTSTMLSLSQKLSKGFSGNEDAYTNFQDCTFTVLPPIDPTVLEEKQSTLALILSRMYRRAEEVWKNCGICGRGFSNAMGPTEADKNDILRLFQKCLNGINATKFRKEESIQDLTVIHEMSDSAVLKLNLYRLTDKFLSFCRRDAAECNRFLVIQLDDTDSQIERCYEILEDIRKYLSLPNVIFLMATDRGLLRTVVAQYFFQTFSVGIEKNVVTRERLLKDTDKYLDKLIAPTNVIYLPQLEEIIRTQSDFLHFRYQEANDSENNLLIPAAYAGDKERSDMEKFSFQSLILRYIYRKTGIAFLELDSHMHGILPTTLRGLSQLLGLLSSMKDVPIIPESEMTKPSQLANKLSEQAEILEQNLTLFEGYFLNDWANVKLTGKRAETIRMLKNVSADERFRIAIDHLREIYQKNLTGPIQYQGYAGMVQYIERLRGLHTEREDTCFFTALLAFQSIQNHKAILFQKKRAAEKYHHSKKEERETLPIVLDLSSDLTDLPKEYYIPEKCQKLNETIWEIDEEAYERAEMQEDTKLVNRYMTTGTENNRKFTVLNLITLFLSVGAASNMTLVNGACPQEKIYKAQEAALFVAANPDVQAVLTAALEKMVLSIGYKSDEDKSDILQRIKKNLTQIDVAINAVNGNHSGKYPMFSFKLGQLLDFTLDAKEDTDSDIPALTHWFEATGLIPNARKKFVENVSKIYNAAKQLKFSLKNDPDTVRDGIEQLSKAARNYREDGFDLEALKLGALSENRGEQFSEEEFWKAFMQQLTSLCENFGVSLEEIIQVEPGEDS